MQNGRILRSTILALSIALGGCESGGTPPAPQPDGRSLVDGGRGRVWTLSRHGLSLREIATTQQRVIALPDWVVAGEPFGDEPALALGPGGDILVTSDVVPFVWRVDPRTLAVTVHRPALGAHRDKDFGFTSIAYSVKDAAYVATSTMPAARWRIDAALTRAELVMSLPLDYPGSMQ